MDAEKFLAHVQERILSISKKEILFVGGMGIAVAILLLPLLQNLGLIALIQKFGISSTVQALILLIVVPCGMVAMLYTLTMLPFRHASAMQLSRYAVIGVFNVALNAAIFNGLMLLSGISTGEMVTVFAIITFFIVVTQSFFWSVYWTFRNTSEKNRARQYMQFVAVSSTVAVINISIIHVLVNVLGAPAGIPSAIWANIALLLTVFTSLLGNFLGYKYVVFSH
jgi:putative flippase GtrA